MKTPVKKFIVHHTKAATTLQEVWCEEVFTQSWELRPGEKRYRILSKLILDKDGQYPIWYSWAVHDTEALALNAAAGGIRVGMERAEQKGRGKFDETELAKQVAMITVERLENEDGQGK